MAFVLKLGEGRKRKRDPVYAYKTILNGVLDIHCTIVCNNPPPRTPYTRAVSRPSQPARGLASRQGLRAVNCVDEKSKVAWLQELVKPPINRK